MTYDLPILVPGHGGLQNGKYTTAPGKMYVHPSGETIFEGVYNREIKNICAALLEFNNIPFIDLVKSEADVSLHTRVLEARKIFKDHPKSFWVEFHLNAGKGTGFEVYTTVGRTKADPMATVMFETFERMFPEWRTRPDWSDGDPDKERDYYTIKNVPQPAILVETFFMDTHKDAEFLLLPETKRKLGLMYFEAIVAIMKL